jgi:hypothetical protein
VIEEIDGVVGKEVIEEVDKVVGKEVIEEVDDKEEGESVGAFPAFPVFLLGAVGSFDAFPLGVVGAVVAFEDFAFHADMKDSSWTIAVVLTSSKPTVFGVVAVDVGSGRDDNATPAPRASDDNDAPITVAIFFVRFFCLIEGESTSASI